MGVQGVADPVARAAEQTPERIVFLRLFRAVDAVEVAVVEKIGLEDLQRAEKYANRMAMPGPEYVAPMVAYLCTDAAKDINGQIFHTEKSLIHTYAYGEVARSIYKYTDGGMFSVDELVKTVPGSLMAGIPNVAPAESETP